jgi:tRNA acetyltransferase TAN1
MHRLDTRFNILVTTFRYSEHNVSNEIVELLKNLGDDNAKVFYTRISGLLLCYTNLDPFIVVNHLYSIVQEEPWRIRYILRCIPIEDVVNTRIEEISASCVRLARAKIGMHESFRITVEKRFASDIHSMDIIRAVAQHIDRKVDLKHYDWNILIEIVGDKSGISVLKQKDVFSSVKAKRYL